MSDEGSGRESEVRCEGGSEGGGTRNAKGTNRAIEGFHLEEGGFAVRCAELIHNRIVFLFPKKGKT